MQYRGKATLPLTASGVLCPDASPSTGALPLTALCSTLTSTFSQKFPQMVLIRKRFYPSLLVVSDPFGLRGFRTWNPEPQVGPEANAVLFMPASAGMLQRKHVEASSVAVPVHWLGSLLTGTLYGNSTPQAAGEFWSTAALFFLGRRRQLSLSIIFISLRSNERKYELETLGGNMVGHGKALPSLPSSLSPSDCST